MDLKFHQIIRLLGTTWIKEPKANIVANWLFSLSSIVERYQSKIAELSLSTLIFIIQQDRAFNTGLIKDYKSEVLKKQKKCYLNLERNSQQLTHLSLN